MALPAELEELVAQIGDAAKREATKKMLLEYHENGLRQADYSRKMNEAQELRKAYEAEHARYLDWYKKAEPAYEAMKGDLQRVEQEKAKLAADIAELEKLKRQSDIGLNPLSPEEEAQVARELKAAKEEQRAAKAELEATKAEMAKFQQTLAAINDKMSKDIVSREEAIGMGDNLGNAVLDIVDFRDRYKEEFGKRLDRAAFLAETKKHSGNFEAAYKAMTEKDREEKMRKEIEAEYDKKYQDRLKAANMPIEQTGGEPTMGPLQARFLKSGDKNGSTIPDDVAADGTGRLASLIAQEMRQEGKY